MRNTVVLLVEDNRRINIANRDMLEIMGFDVDIAETIAAARAVLNKRTPDVTVLDIMLPDGSGLDFLKELRAAPKTAHMPIIMLTALGTPDDVVTGLGAGADDYIAKPYEYKVLASRIDALLRRSTRLPETLTRGALCIDLIANRAFLNGVNLFLTQKEFALLLLLMRNEGSILSAEYLYETVWQQSLAGDKHAVQTLISKLRKKIRSSGFDITNLRGAGYIFE